VRARLSALSISLWTLAAVSPAPARYDARQTGEVVQLSDAGSDTRVAVLPAFGNMAFEFSVKRHNFLRWPHASIDEFKAKPGAAGIPFLAPWANRLDEQAFYANGKRYPFDMEQGNVRGPIPIHGFLQTTDRWRVIDLKADGQSASVTSRLEFFRETAWMKQWPFAHTVEITHRLHNGELEVRTRIMNLSAEPMPVSIGFHPYFQLTDSMRDEWTITVGARTRWLLADNKLPTGETEPIERLFPTPGAVPLKDYNLDDVFSDLARDREGRATMSVIGKTQRLDVMQGSNFRATVIFAPRNQNFICFEPMASITNALNLAQKGVYKGLQSVASGGVWEERFWIRPSGF